MLQPFRSCSNAPVQGFRPARRHFVLLAAAALIAPAFADAALAQGAAPVVKEHVLGDPDAPVTLIEYASFGCPHCADFHRGPLKQIKKDYIDTGKVKLLYREVYFDRWGLWAAMIARCGGAARYFGIVELLYERQDDWLRGGDAATLAENLRTIGRTAGLDSQQIDACLADQALAEAMVARYRDNAATDNIRSTPSFVIGSTTYGNMPLDRLRGLLDAELAR